MDRDRVPHLVRNINHVGNEANDDTSKVFWTVGGTGIGHEA
jgi:hypothetical protein